MARDLLLDFIDRNAAPLTAAAPPSCEVSVALPGPWSHMDGAGDLQRFRGVPNRSGAQVARGRSNDFVTVCLRSSSLAAAGAVASCPMPAAPRDFPPPPLRRVSELLSKSISPSPPSAGAGEGRAVPASQSHPDHPAREAGPKEENHR
jgi:hypothetical protein